MKYKATIEDKFFIQGYLKIEAVRCKVAVKVNSTTFIGIGFKSGKGFIKAFQHIVFFGSEKRKEKNLDLARDAVNDMAEKDIDFHIINNVPFVDIPGLLSAADVLVLTSFWEGAPNIIKEAMACDLPLVATDVGDIREVIGNCEGCYICSFDKDDISVKLKEALDFNKRTDGRNHIRNIESSYIAGKIIEIYKTLIK